MSTIGAALAGAARRGVARLDSHLLMLHALGRPSSDRAWLLAHDDDPIEATALHRFATACDRRLAGEPVAYLLGRQEFHGLDLRVDTRVLVPRADTETLVDWALELLHDRQSPRVLDLGTGSGAIALAVSKARPDAQVEAVDASADALIVARDNARRLGLPVTFRQADWLAGAQGPYDLVLSNPPYIADGDPHLPALAHEPREALVAGVEGLDDLRRIAREAPAVLAPGGWLLLEHGWDQAAAVRQLLAAAGLADAASRRDLAGIERCSGARRLEAR